MKEKIKQLLTSDNAEDILIGWELLKANKPASEDEWAEYIAYLHYRPDISENVDTLQCELIQEICGKNPMENSIYGKVVKIWENKRL